MQLLAADAIMSRHGCDAPLLARVTFEDAGPSLVLPCGRTNMRGVMKIPSRGILFAALVIPGAWSSLALVGLFRSNPFRVATETAAVRGDWPLEQVRFDRGQYRFLGVFSTVEAHVTASTAETETAARIRLTHVPLRGWATTEFEVLSNLPDKP